MIKRTIRDFAHRVLRQLHHLLRSGAAAWAEKLRRNCELVIDQLNHFHCASFHQQRNDQDFLGIWEGVVISYRRFYSTEGATSAINRRGPPWFGNLSMLWLQRRVWLFLACFRGCQ
jgi:hypothetical protein